MAYCPIARWIAALVLLLPGSLALAQDADWEKNSDAGRERVSGATTPKPSGC